MKSKKDDKYILYNTNLLQKKKRKLTASKF